MNVVICISFLLILFCCFKFYVDTVKTHKIHTHLYILFSLA